MKKTILLFGGIFLLLLFSYSVQAIPGGEFLDGCQFVGSTTPSDFEEDVQITQKGVETCATVKVLEGCSANITFAWFNFTAWEFQNYSTFVNVTGTATLCANNTNVTCWTEGDFPELWRIYFDFNCTQGTYVCSRYYLPEICPQFKLIHPPWNATPCPCCVNLCIKVNNTNGNPMNITVYGREEGETHWYDWAEYNYKENGTYCHCLGGYSRRPHALGHTREEIIPDATNTWYNITFQHFDAEGFTGSPSEIIIPVDSHYNLLFWATCRSESANPAGDKIGFRFTRNGNEINSSYHELDFPKQDSLQDVFSYAHSYLEQGDKIQFQYIVNNLNVHIYENSTWSSNNTSALASIEMADIEEVAMKFNTTYYWYARTTDTVTGEKTNSTIFNFTTEKNLSDCPCGPEEMIESIEEEIGGEIGIRDDAWILGVASLFSVFGIVAYAKMYSNKKKKNRRDQIDERRYT